MNAHSPVNLVVDRCWDDASGLLRSARQHSAELLVYRQADTVHSVLGLLECSINRLASEMKGVPRPTDDMLAHFDEMVRRLDVMKADLLALSGETPVLLQTAE